MTASGPLAPGARRWGGWGMASPLPPGQGLSGEDLKRRPAKSWSVAKQSGCSQHTKEPRSGRTQSPPGQEPAGSGLVSCIVLLRARTACSHSPNPRAAGEVTPQSWCLLLHRTHRHTRELGVQGSPLFDLLTAPACCGSGPFTACHGSPLPRAQSSAAVQIKA